MPFDWKDEADGYLAVHLPGVTEPVNLDLFEVNNVYAEMTERHGEDAVSLGTEWCQWLGDHGILHKGKGVPHGIGFAIADKAMEQIAEFKKKFGTAASSPAQDSQETTGNPSGDSTPPTQPPPTS